MEMHEIRVMRDSELPAEFQASNMYKGLTDERVACFRAYLESKKVYYYARPRESFFPFEAFELAAKAGCTAVLLEDMS